MIGNLFEQYDLQGGNEVQLYHRIVGLCRLRFKVNSNVCKSPIKVFQNDNKNTFICV